MQLNVLSLQKIVGLLGPMTTTLLDVSRDKVLNIGYSGHIGLKNITVVIVIGDIIQISDVSVEV